MTKSNTLQWISQHAVPLRGAGSDYDALLDVVADAQYVLLGEATHGTHEFYDARARITRRLIEEKQFSAVVVEADWPDAYRVHRYVTGQGDADAAERSLSDFTRFPRWMWRNTDIRNLIAWLRTHNETLAAFQRVGFYGMDLYSLHRSMEAVIAYLENVDPDAARRARERYACFDNAGDDPQAYGYAARLDLSRSCEDEVVAQLIELRERADEYLRRDGFVAEDALFHAQQNARLARNAEQYYRSMFDSRTISWNQRDRHMAETLEAIERHLSRGGKPARLVVWAHNSHLGDARATDWAQTGELNVGQLVRERVTPRSSVHAGFTTFSGTVAAASDWDGPVEEKQIRPALHGSIEDLMHSAAMKMNVPNFMLNLRDPIEPAPDLATPRLQRAIGVIYRPETERQSHYFNARVAQQFDVLIHFDHSTPVEPLDRA